MGQLNSVLIADLKLEAGPLAEKKMSENALRHLKAFRLRPGESLQVLDGAGGVAVAEATADRQNPLSIRSITHKLPLSPQLHLCLAPPKGDDLWQAVQQSTEIGVANLHFVRSEYAQIAKGQNVPVERAQRVSDAAVEQCGRAWRVGFDADWWELSAGLAKPGVHIVADEALAGEKDIGFFGAPPVWESLAKDAPIYLWIGPEGGWSERERAVFTPKAHRLGLGNLVLRVPTACVAALHFLRLVHTHNR